MTAAPPAMTSAEDLRALADAVADFLAAQGGEAAVRAVMESGKYDETAWQQMCTDLGLPGLAVSEANGGAGGGLRELAAVLEEVGKALFPSPLLATSLAAWALDQVADSAAAAAMLPRLVGGTARGTVVVGPAASALQVDHGQLTGDVPAVLDAAGADLLLVAARDGLYAVEGGSSGLVVTDRVAIDPTRPLADLSFAAVAAERIGDWPMADRLAAVAATAVACEQVGGAAVALETAVSYAKIRSQFGAPIGSFQAIKHRCADTLLAVESGRAAARRAARAIDSDDPETDVFASIAKAWCSDAYVSAAEASLQIHGGIGFTWEHVAHLHVKRAKTDEFLFGDARHHREQLAQLLGLQRSSS
jgi:alkylation response protein AidB-like acyl-CoA dehydrogenase